MLFDDADSLKNFINVLNLEKFSLLGFSAGSITSYVFASKYPENVEKLILISPSTFVSDNQIKYFNSIRDVNKWPSKLKKEAIEIYGIEYLKYLWENFVDLNQNIQAEITLDVIKPIIQKVKVETLILYGKKDPFIHPVNDIQTLEENIQNSKVIFYPHGRHKLQTQFPSEINENIKDFLEVKCKI